MEHLTALLKFRNSAVIQLVDLEDGHETRYSYPWQESLEEVMVMNGGHGPSHILVSNDGAHHDCDFDGKDKLVQMPVVSFRLYCYRPFPECNMGVAFGYDDDEGVEKVAFINMTDGSVIREKLANQYVTAGDYYINLSSLVTEGFGTFWVDRFVTLIGPINGECKIAAYDPVSDMVTLHNLPGSTNDFSHAAGYCFRKYNNRLLVLPSKATRGTTLPGAANCFKVDVNFVATPSLVSGFYSLSSAFENEIAYTSFSAVEESRYVVYSHLLERISGVSFVAFDIETMLISEVVRQDVPADQFNVIPAQINQNASLMTTAYLGDRLVGWMSEYTDVDGELYPQNKLFVWNLTTGNYLKSITYSLDSDEVDPAELFLFLVQPYRVDGTVRVSGAGVKTKVELLDEDTSRLLAVKDTALNGSYEFRCYTNRKKSVIATHPVMGYRKPASVLVPTLLD